MLYEITTWSRTKRRAAMKLRWWAHLLDPAAAASDRMLYAAYEGTKRELHSAWVALDQKAEIIGSLERKVAAGGSPDEQTDPVQTARDLIRKARIACNVAMQSPHGGSLTWLLWDAREALTDHGNRFSVHFTEKTDAQ